ncbi:MAG: YihY/virulence factor BrkB family protein, partial [Myxococcales bacterium]|nr:YihY/virulence factor BrkB family protein [Myxococcales bacterium]
MGEDHPNTGDGWEGRHATGAWSFLPAFADSYGWRSWVGSAIAGLRIALERDTGTVAAGLGFFGLFAFFPFVVGVISIYGMASDPSDVTSVARSLSQTLPPQAARVISE